mgnify:CR=1 FL=1
MKAAREHIAPLSYRAVEILQVIAGLKSNYSNLVFPGSKPGRPISDMAITMLYRRLELDVTGHGFRSTFRDWCAEQTNFPRNLRKPPLRTKSAIKLRGPMQDPIYSIGDGS